MAETKTRGVYDGAEKIADLTEDNIQQLDYGFTHLCELMPIPSCWSITKESINWGSSLFPSNYEEGILVGDEFEVHYVYCQLRKYATGYTGQGTVAPVITNFISLYNSNNNSVLITISIKENITSFTATSSSATPHILETQQTKTIASILLRGRGKTLVKLNSDNNLTVSVQEMNL